MATDPVELNVAAELAELSGTMREGFAKLSGQIALIAQSQVVTAADVADLDQRVDALEARRIPWGLLSSVAGAAGMFGGLASFLSSSQ